MDTYGIGWWQCWRKKRKNGLFNGLLVGVFMDVMDGHNGYKFGMKEKVYLFVYAVW